MRAMPTDCRPGLRWIAAGCFEALAHDLPAALRQASGRNVSNAIRNCPLCVMKNCPHRWVDGS